MKQSDLIKQMSDKELVKQIFLSQFIFLLLSILLSLIFFDHFINWLHYFNWNMQEIIIYGGASGVIIVTVDLILMYLLPKEHFDDGGINEKVFRNQSVVTIFFIALFVAISEEMLFRGVVQTTFGYLFASLLFAFVHIRYLKKPVLFVSVLIISFYIGYLFELTQNLNVTILAHFTIDFLLGLIIRFKK